jgi:hypothetical protein
MKCPKCNNGELCLTSYDPVFVIENKEKANDPDLYPKLDPIFHCQLKCFECGFDKWIDADIKYPTWTEKEQFKSSINQSVDFKRLIDIDWNKYDDIAIHPCAAFDDKDVMLPWENLDLATNMERVSEDSKKTCWSVYLHLVGGTTDCIADFKDKEEAEQFEQFILKHFLKHVPKEVNLTLSCRVGQHANEPALREIISNAIKHSDNCTAMIKDFDIYHLKK